MLTVAGFVGALVVLAPEDALAELVTLTTGRTLSVKAHRVEGDTMVLVLRSGGEIACPLALIGAVAPDEVPYPDRDEPDSREPSPASGVPFPVPAEYAGIIDRVSAAHGVDANLVRALIHVESRYQPRARSPKGAMGLMQLMPATARRLEVDNPYDPEGNIEGGVRHLRALLDRFDVALALAAYNAGEAAVERHRGIPPYAETRSYVRDVMRLAGLAGRRD